MSTKAFGDALQVIGGGLADYVKFSAEEKRQKNLERIRQQERADDRELRAREREEERTWSKEQTEAERTYRKEETADDRVWRSGEAEKDHTRRMKELGAAQAAKDRESEIEIAKDAITTAKDRVDAIRQARAKLEKTVEESRLKGAPVDESVYKAQASELDTSLDVNEAIYQSTLKSIEKKVSPQARKALGVYFSWDSPSGSGKGKPASTASAGSSRATPATSTAAGLGSPVLPTKQTVRPIPQVVAGRLQQQ